MVCKNYFKNSEARLIKWVQIWNMMHVSKNDDARVKLDYVIVHVQPRSSVHV